ncbi:MAG TPA: M15 family metallopeptidase [Rubrivivax sp.]|jgi:hypothetical protein|nr:M15 family metallopeptidase [Rubrivivax sp.]
MPLPPPASPVALTLRQRQSRFAVMVAQLILHAQELGYEVTLGDAYRDPRVFGELGQRMGYGESRSAHKLRLAVDLNLFRGGQWLRETADHEQLGLWWEAQGGSWGGRWHDGNHYSLAHEGVQ